jgi:hypothetical protein
MSTKRKREDGDIKMVEHSEPMPQSSSVNKSSFVENDGARQPNTLCEALLNKPASNYLSIDTINESGLGLLISI